MDTIERYQQDRHAYATKLRLEKFWDELRATLLRRDFTPPHERYRLERLPAWFELCQDAPDFVRAAPPDVRHALGIPAGWR